MHKSSRHSHTNMNTLRLWMKVMVVGVVCAYALHKPTVKKSEIEIRYCGNDLFTTLRGVCNGTYYSPNDGYSDIELKRSLFALEKRDVDNSIWMMSPYGEEPVRLQFPFRSRSLSNSLTNKFFRRQTRIVQIVDECCNYKGCVTSELMEYCGSR